MKNLETNGKKILAILIGIFSFLIFSLIIYLIFILFKFENLVYFYLFNPYIIFVLIFILLLIIFILILVSLPLFKKMDKNYDRYIKRVTRDGKQIIIDRKINISYPKIDYFRDIPCNKNIYVIYWIALQYNLCSKNTLEKGLIGSILLKWVDNKNIVFKSTLFNKNNKISFSNNPKFDDELEKLLFEKLIRSSNYNKILEKNEFENWCEKNYLELVIWLKKVDFEVVNHLIEKNIIKIINKNKAKFTPIIYKEYLKISGLKNFLNDFTTLDENYVKNIKMWKDYLMMAELFGIADKIKKQLEELYPDLIKTINFELPTIDLIDEILGYIHLLNPIDLTV